MMISGDNFLPDVHIETDYAFSKYFPIWGWATWRRAWQQYDVQMKDWERATRNKSDSGDIKMLNELYPEDQKYMRNHMERLFDDIVSGKTNTWDVQWLYACLRSGGFCIIPRKNLVSNIGSEGTHSGGSNQHLATHDLYADGAIVHPATAEGAVAAGMEYDRAFYERSFRPEPFSLKKTVIAIAVKSELLKKLYRLVTRKKA